MDVVADASRPRDRSGTPSRGDAPYRLRDRLVLGADGLDPALHGLDAVLDRFLDGLAVGHAAGQVGELDEIAPTVPPVERPDP